MARWSEDTWPEYWKYRKSKFNREVVHEGIGAYFAKAELEILQKELEVSGDILDIHPKKSVSFEP